MTDYEVFQPSNEHLAQIIVGILEARGYHAGYQLGYPNNKVFIKVDSKAEADKISGLIKKFMRKHSFSETGLPTTKLNILISKLTDLIPQSSGKGKIEKIDENLNPEKKTETPIPEAAETDVSVKVKLEELRREITERIRFLDAQIAKNPNDPSNENRTTECDTLNWVLRNLP